MLIQTKLGNKRFLFSTEMDGVAYAVTVQRGIRKPEIKTFWKRNLPSASC